MASQSRVAECARRWLAGRPGAAEAELRAALFGWFLGRPSDGPAAAGDAGAVFRAAAAAPDPCGYGCLAGCRLAPAAFAWRLVFPRAPTRPEDIESVLTELRAGAGGRT